ncbi:MAG TPA: L-ribulose-5-phosphate 4-epimerase AraD [Vicinamibacterales bacterium]|nr:L-ribulose-5-phosphate 4-epimerase AraD [Vicinamibacterales bacterium]
MPASDLREIVYKANRKLAETGLVFGTFGNVSAVDRAARVLAIKPSGVAYEALTPQQIVMVSLETGRPVNSDWRPSSDTATHLELYRAFPSIGGVVHTHSEYATVFAQARQPIRCMGTTHADYFHGDIPVTRAMSQAEVDQDYEKNTGLLIVDTLRLGGLSPDDMPAVLVANHGPFTWGADALKAIEYAEALEYVARVEWRVCTLNPDAPRPDRCLVERHHSRKHGPSAYYGQVKDSKERKESKKG